MNRDTHLIWEGMFNPINNLLKWKKIKDLLDKSIRPLVKLETKDGTMILTAQAYGRGPMNPGDPDDDQMVLQIYGQPKGGNEAININVSDPNVRIVDIVHENLSNE